MLATIDLTPVQFHQRRRKKARMRGYALLAVSLCIAFGGFGAYSIQQAGDVDHLTRAGARLESGAAGLNKECATLSAELQRTQRVLQQAQRLREGHQWSRVLNYLGTLVPERVLLVMVATDPQEPGRVVASAPRQKQNGDPVQEAPIGPRALAMRGYALGHQDLAMFLSNLKEGNVFTSVHLLHTKREPFLDAEGIGFTLTCHW